MMIGPQLTVFQADWLTVQVVPTQAMWTTVDLARSLDLRDVVLGIFELLPETPVDALGINFDVHFRTDSEKAWHAFGDMMLLKDFWEPLFDDDQWKKRPDGKRVGMRVMT